MPIIKLEIHVNAPIERVFDLSRSIDLHKVSLSRTRERVVGGRASGLIEEGESVTWEARHFGVTQRLTSKIVKFERPNHFRDSMVEGVFLRFDHDHFFIRKKDSTLVTDIFDYDSPFSVLGEIADRLFLKAYMTRLLFMRNEFIKKIAEGDDWSRFLNEKKLSGDPNRQYGEL